MKHPKYILLSSLPIYLLFFILGFYAVIYKENPISRVIAVISMIIFTIMLILLVSKVLDASKQNKNRKIT
ncbi:hypothetical protein [Mammaliicoccus sciuri]|uniref:hypothetical protein n=1 Tax=Mammaliicoccus sciuri TaxID=1296 RepID=UPI0021CDFC23|nr:hypothetical protein [Mammaliicoccus sciuri]UXV31501.1 hypothetical protein MUA60_11130 [Mammaliicoccus sciuri]